MRFTSLYFDLDDTLYSASSGLWDAIRSRMNTYMQKFMDLPLPEIAAIRQGYMEKFGTTLRGLQAHYEVDADDYLRYVHDLPLEQFIHPDPGLRELITSLPQHKWIFTNADRNHAGRVLKILGMEDCFDGIIDIHAVGYACKPDILAYQRALEITSDDKTDQCVIFDDAVRNLAPARKLGFYTILVGKDGPEPQVDRVVPNMHALKVYFPELWENSRKPADEN